MIHQVSHIVTLEGRLLLSILRIVLGQNQPLKHIQISLSLEESLVHLTRVLHEVFALVICGKTVHHTPAEVVRLKEALFVAKGKPVRAIACMDVAHTKGPNRAQEKTKLPPHSEQRQLVVYVLCELKPAEM